MKYVVLGAGMMGSAAAYDLAASDPACEVVLGDINLQRATAAARAIGPNVRPERVDVNNPRDVGGVLAGAGALVSAVSYGVNVQLTRAAIAAGVHMCDLGGNNDVVDRQLALSGEAAARDVLVVPNTGLAPGLINILAVTGAGRFDELDSIQLRVGGLPQAPRPPLYYQIVFSVEGLINEYSEKATVIRDGEILQIDPMEDLEEIVFPEPYGALEAFSTSGGLSTLTTHFHGRVKNLEYKTIRYRGHCEKFKTLLDLGFATSEPMMVGGSVKTNREFFADLLRKKLDYGDRDVVLARATILGTSAGRRKRLVYECIDVYDEVSTMTAMMRTTAFPAAITARMMADGTLTARGVMPPEACVPGDLLIEQLRRRNVRITTTVTETWG